MIIGLALEVLRKEYGCRTAIDNDCFLLGSGACDGCEHYVDADTVTEALKTVLDAFGNGSELPNSSQTKFKPGSKFLLEIGEKRIGLDEYSIVGTDLYVWGSLLEKLTPYETDGDVEFWRKRSKEYENMVGELVSKMSRSAKLESMEMNADGLTFKMKEPSVQTEQKKGDTE